MATRPVSKPRRPKAATRTIILEHAYCMYLDGRLAPGDERLAVVLDELGYTTGAGYQIWDNQADFREELAEFIVENLDYASLQTAAESIAELSDRQLPFEQHVLAAGDRFMQGFLGQGEFYLKLRFVAMTGDGSARVIETLGAAYENAGLEAAELLETLLQKFGRRVRPPLEMRDMTGAVTAALEGYALRERVQPDSVSKEVPEEGGQHHMFSVVFLAIMNDFTEPIAD